MFQPFLTQCLNCHLYLGVEGKIPVLKCLEQEIQDNIVAKKVIEDERPEDSNPAKKLQGEKRLVLDWKCVQ